MTRSNPRRVSLSVAAAVAMLGAGALASAPAEAARICKDGYLTYTGNGPSANEADAKANALGVWRAMRVGQVTRGSLPRPEDVQCLRGGSEPAWRCYIRAGLCKTS